VICNLDKLTAVNCAAQLFRDVQTAFSAVFVRRLGVVAHDDVQVEKGKWNPGAGFRLAGAVLCTHDHCSRAARELVFILFYSACKDKGIHLIWRLCVVNHHLKRSCLLKGSHSFTCASRHSSTIGMSPTCLCLPSYSRYSFTNPGGMEGWVDLGVK